jgi:cytochrome P450
MDPPEHQRHRALISVAFRQRTLARWEESLVRRLVDELIDEFVARGRTDLLREYTFGFPTKVIAGVLGLPEGDYEQFQHWAIGIMSVAHDWDYAIQCATELRTYLEPIVDARRSDPRDDLITDLVTAELDGEKLDDEEIYSFSANAAPSRHRDHLPIEQQSSLPAPYSSRPTRRREVRSLPHTASDRRRTSL